MRDKFPISKKVFQRLTVYIYWHLRRSDFNEREGFHNKRESQASFFLASGQVLSTFSFIFSNVTPSHEALLRIFQGKGESTP